MGWIGNGAIEMDKIEWQEAHAGRDILSDLTSNFCYRNRQGFLEFDVGESQSYPEWDGRSVHSK